MYSGRQRSRWHSWPFVLLAFALAVAGPRPDSLADAETPPQLSPARLPAGGRHEAILTVPQFGRYAVTVHSAQGTGLQLIDRLAGPSEVEGTPGKSDGRIDRFLE